MSEVVEFKIEQIQNPNVDEAAKRPLLSSKRKKLIIIGAAVILAIALVFFFLGRGAFSDSRVDFKIDGPTEVSAGELITYKIIYKNNNKVALSGVKLSVFYPADAVVTRDGGVLNVTNENFDLSDLERGASGEKVLTAYIVGDRGNVKTIKATFSFTPASIRSKFQKDATLATTITSLAVPITLVAPPTVIGGQGLSYLIDYRNQSDQDLESLRFKVNYPSGFKSSKYSPQPTSRLQNQDIWDIAKIKQDSGNRITIQGTLSGKERDSKIISVVLQKKVATPAGDIYIDFEKTEATSVISTPPLSLNITLDDSADYTAHLSDLLHYKLEFKNNNNADVTGLSLSARLEGGMFDFSTVKSDGFFDGRTNTISWNASTTPALNNLGANQSAAVTFEVRLKSSFSGGTGAKDSFVKVSAHIETPNVPAGLDIEKLSADGELITRISGSPTFSQKMFLNDQVFGSSGPFPLKVNRKTVFTVRWILVNPSNDISQAKATAVLAPGVSWEGRVRVDGTKVEPVYDSRSNTFTWDLGTLPGGVGVSFPKYEADFQISVIPSINQVDQLVTFLKNARFDGTDSFTQERISRTIQDATSAEIGDSKESGLVQQ